MFPNDNAGDPVRIPLFSQKHPGLFALVDPQDLEAVSAYRWTAEPNQTTIYASARVERKTVRMHRLITRCPPGFLVDHINHDGLDNRRGNLRICTRQQNGWNRHQSGLRAVAGYWGVEVRFNRFRAYIQVDGRLIRLGNFDTAEEAARARDAAAREYYGEFATLNFPDEPEVA